MMLAEGADKSVSHLHHDCSRWKLCV